MLGAGSLVGNLDDKCVPPLEIRAHSPSLPPRSGRALRALHSQPWEDLAQLEPVHDRVVHLGGDVQFEAHGPLGELVLQAHKDPVEQPSQRDPGGLALLI